jgi:hypothetical protein
MTDYHVTDEKAHAITQAAIRVEIARKVLEARKFGFDDACAEAVNEHGNNLFQYSDTEGWFYLEGGEPCTDDPKWKKFWAARVVRAKAARQLGARRAALTRMVRALKVRQ